MTEKTDEQIKHDVTQELKWDTRVNENEIGVAVKEGVVTLMGTTRSYIEKLAAQEAAHRVAGVLDVANDIDVRVHGSFARTDQEIAQAVRWALEWDVLVPHERIRSTVTHGFVTLEGTVGLVREREDAEQAVWRLAGVCGVGNRIEVSGPHLDAEQMRTEIQAALARRAQREAQRIDVRVHEGEVTLSGKVDSWSEKRAVLGLVRHAPGVHSVRDELHIDPHALVPGEPWMRKG
jgi:osmotically-inducible protein OsmY